METAMIAGILAHPVALAILFGIAFSSVAVCNSIFAPATLSKRRLWCALGGVALAALIAAAVFAYASPEQARQFGVPEEHRWSAIWREFLVLSISILYVGIVGASLVGIPLALLMTRKGVATVPWYVAASLPISLFFAVPLALLVSSPHQMQDVAFFAGNHAWLAFGFAVGARLRWRTTTSTANVA